LQKTGKLLDLIIILILKLNIMKLQSFINGVAVGLVFGVLFAPASGEETRRRLSRRVNDIKDTARNTYDDISSKVTDGIDRVKGTAGKLMNQAEDKYNNALDETSDLYTSERL
jgi:gas vesicle protein